MLVLCHYRLGGISLILATSDLLRSWHAGSTVECHLSFIENTFFLWTCSIPIMLSVILAMSWHEILEWSFAAFYFPSQSTWHVFFFLFFFVVVSFATLGGWWVSFFPLTVGDFLGLFLFSTWTVFHYISGGCLICFALMLSMSVLNFLSYSLLILLLDMLDDWRLVCSST